MTVNILGKEFSDTEFTSQVPRVPYPNTDMPEGFFVSNKVQMKVGKTKQLRAMVLQAT